MLRSLSLALSIVASLVGCSTPGAFFGVVDGPAFVAHPSADASHATVYLYRPRSQWADEELEAPGIFLNNELIGSLPSNGYLAFEFETGSYKLEMRRPLAGSFWTLFADGPMDFTRIASFMLEARAGSVYYLRYDELNPPPKSEHPAGEGDGPLQWWRPISALRKSALPTRFRSPCSSPPAATGACSARSGKASGGPWTRSASEPGTRVVTVYYPRPLRIGYLRCIPGMTGPCPKECA